MHELVFSFPAIRGVQAGREYFVAMVRLSHLIRLIPLEDQKLPAEFRAQRFLNRGRLPSLCRYITQNPRGYVFSAISASIGGEARFDPISTDTVQRKLGVLHVSADAPVAINDGQHRRAAIERALKERPELGRESIAVVFFIDAGLKRSQQMFADLNRFPVRPTKSLTILYDHRDPLGQLANRVAEEVSVFAGMTEKAKTTISNRCVKLFTLSSIYYATKRLLGKRDGDDLSRKEQHLALDFWRLVSENMPDWQKAASGEIHPAKLRATKIHAHGVVLQALAGAGTDLIAQFPRTWQKRLRKLPQIDWARNNTSLWEGRALHQGRISKSQASVAATVSVIKQALGVTRNR